MSEYELRKILGMELYDRGKEMVDSGSVKMLPDRVPGIEIYETKGHIVIYRSYDDKREPLYDCDCSGGLCIHKAAVAIFRDPPVYEGSKDDPNVIEDIESQIDSIADDVLGDDSYDEDANYYEEWEMWKYDLENNNADVEYDYTRDICDRIVEEVKEPKNVLLLFDRLHTRVNKDFECDNGGFDDAFSEYEKELRAAFHYATPDIICEIISNESGYGPSWAMEFIKDLPNETFDKAYQMGKQNHSNSDTMREEMFRRGEYEDYVESSGNKTEAMLRVGEELMKGNDVERASRICSGLARCKQDKYYATRIAEVLKWIGNRDGAADVYHDIFLDSPTREHMQSVLENGSRYTRDTMLDEAERVAEQRGECDLRLLTFLTVEGRDAFVSKLIRTKGIWGDSRFSHRDRCFTGALGLSESLANKGRFDEAAIVARYVIEYRLERKNPKSYDDAVGLLKFMGSMEGFESIEPSHGEYLAKLKDRYPKMRKFWGLYRGTWW